MTLRWKKLGQIFVPNGTSEWMYSHAATPVATHIKDDLYRIFFSSRDRNNRSHIGFLEIRIESPYHLLYLSEKPVLSPGLRGSFDDSGVSISSLLTISGASYLYYVGWNLGVTVPFRNSIGLAVAQPNSLNYTKNSSAPLLDRSDVDPYSLSYPFVMKDEGIYRMWYGSNLAWGENLNDMKHVIKYAESLDGKTWSRQGVIAIDLMDEQEIGLARPTVIYINQKYVMIFSRRMHNGSYCLGYAESENGTIWHRLNDYINLCSSDNTGWDSEMICYPWIFQHQEQIFLLYCGNGYGKTGFGIAMLDGNF